ncbi:MAG: hypothetical protein C0395_00455 [Gemmatimonas sp.]|nr:hypothetical protein [Gemmatimonas sp.]
MITTEHRAAEDPGPVDDIFEILVTTHARGLGRVPLDDDLTWRPATDAYETEDAFVVQMDLAGMDPAAIEVFTDGGSLTVRGTRQDIAPAGKKHYSKMEISVGPFARRIAVPVPVQPETAVARYRNGFLYVTFRKGPAAAGGRRRVDVGNGK